MDREEFDNLDLSRLHQAIEATVADDSGPERLSAYGFGHPVDLLISLCSDLARRRAEQFGSEVGEATGIMLAFRFGAAYARQE